MRRSTAFALAAITVLGVSGCTTKALYDSAPAAQASSQWQYEIDPTISGGIVEEMAREDSLHQHFATPGLATTSLASSGPDTRLPDAPDAEPAPEPVARLMIYTARFAILVANADEARESFIADVKERGGYLQERSSDSITCRVPAAEFDAVVEALRGAGKVLNEHIQASDVTKKFYDLKIRLDNARKGRDRLLALLEKAEEVKDLLAIEEQLRRLTEEIERHEGELKYLSQQIAFSTVTVSFRSNAPPPSAVRGRTWSRFWWINQIGVENVLDDF